MLRRGIFSLTESCLLRGCRSQSRLLMESLGPYCKPSSQATAVLISAQLSQHVSARSAESPSACTSRLCTTPQLHVWMAPGWSMGISLPRLQWPTGASPCRVFSAQTSACVKMAQTSWLSV